jgi:hypothetical protein
MMIGGTSVLKGGKVWGRKVRCRKRSRFALRGPWCCSFLRGLLTRLRRILSGTVTQHGRNAAERRAWPSFKEASGCCASRSAAIENPKPCPLNDASEYCIDQATTGEEGISWLQITQRRGGGD